MSLRDCLDIASNDGDITPEQTVYVRDLYDAIYDENLQTMSPEQADIAAGKQTYDKMKADAAHAKRVKILQAVKFTARAEDMLRYPDLKKLVGSETIMRPGKALQALVEADNRSQGVSLKYYEEAVQNQLFANMDAVLFEFRRTITGGQRNKATQLDLVKEAFGEDSGNISARELAGAWAQTHELARQRANAAGMRINKRQDYGLPQIHDQRLIREVSKDEWISFTEKQLDMAGMIDGKTGLPFNEQTLRMALSEVYDSIKTDSLNDLIPGTSPRGRALHNRRTDSRFLKFKNAEAWVKYQERFGNPDVFETMVDHLRSMAHDITKLEVLGPNPDATVSALRAYAKKKVSETTGNDAPDALKADLVKFDTMYKLWDKGETVANTRAALVMGGTRNVISSALLGGAPVTALSDFNTQRIAAQFIGMPTTPLMARVFREMKQDPNAAKFAARMGLVADNYIDVGSQNARFFGDAMQPGVTRRIADTVHRASGLTGFTRAGRQAFGLEFQGYLADEVGKTFDQLHPGMQQIMKADGIGPADWNAMRATKLLDENGGTFLRLLDVADRGDLPKMYREELAMKAMSMMERQIDQAVPTSTIRARSTMIGPSDKGTFIGEVVRGTAMFKSFPVTLMHQNLGRMMAIQDPKKRYAAVAGFLISSTILGGMILNTKQILYGRDPRPMDSPEFWVAALLQGGGLGIAGDFLFSNINRFGGGFATTLAGPAAGMGTDAINLTAGNLLQLASGDDTNFAREMTDFAVRYTPGSSIWYLRLATERMLVDQIRLATDPKARKTFRRRTRRWERDYDQGSWWQQGDFLPRRSPDLGNVVR